MRFLRYVVICIFLGFFSLSASAAFTQLVTEAESVSGGTVISDSMASGGSSVTRTTDGIYVWWLIDTSPLTVGPYSVYIRAKVASSSVASVNFGAVVYYGTTSIGSQNLSITNHSYSWIRVASVDLPQIGGQLRISDYSAAGLDVDKLAVVKDVAIEAELSTTGPIIADTSASGGRAVALSTAGNYSSWTPSQGDLQLGDYDLYARIASADGASHNFGEDVNINGVDDSYINSLVTSATYQWIKLNSFVNSGGSTAIRIADYSQPGLKLDQLRLIKRTPYEKMSSVQNLFAGGVAALGPREQMVFTGIPTGLTYLQDPGGISVVQADASTVYAYFRQHFFSPNDHWQIYVAKSVDGGKTFAVVPDPIIPITLNTAATNAYDPTVIKRPDGYYMVFEGTISGCNHFSSIAAFSVDGVTNWQVKNTPICTVNPIASVEPYKGSASVPDFFVDAESGANYIIWASENDQAEVTSQFLATLPNGIFVDQLKFGGTDPQMTPYAIPRDKVNSWDYQLNASSSIKYEDGYYYMAYDGATNYKCAGQWGLGMMRTKTPGVVNSWVRSTKNPFILASNIGSCWVSYPKIATINSVTYLYYQDPEVHLDPPDYQGPVNNVFRSAILPSDK